MGTPDKPYGVKAYGRWTCFGKKREYERYLMDWLLNTDGAERDRAVRAICALERGVKRLDTDNDLFGGHR